jgi:hypothetical protein
VVRNRRRASSTLGWCSDGGRVPGASERNQPSFNPVGMNLLGKQRVSVGEGLRGERGRN